MFFYHTLRLCWNNMHFYLHPFLCAFQNSWLFCISACIFCLHSNSDDKQAPIFHHLNILHKGVHEWISSRIIRRKFKKCCLSLVGNALLEDDKVFHLVRPADELDEIKSKRGSIKDKSMTKAITEIYLTRLLSVKVQRQNHLFNQTFVK